MPDAGCFEAPAQAAEAVDLETAGEANLDVVASGVVSKTRDHDREIADTEEHTPTQDNWCCKNFRGKYKHSMGLANGVLDSGGTILACFRMLKCGPTIANIMEIFCGSAQVVLAPAS